MDRSVSQQSSKDGRWAVGLVGGDWELGELAPHFAGAIHIDRCPEGWELMSDAFPEVGDATAVRALAGETLRLKTVSQGFCWTVRSPSLSATCEGIATAARRIPGYSRSRSGRDCAWGPLRSPSAESSYLHNHGNRMSSSPSATNACGRSLPFLRSGQPGTASMPLSTRS